MDRMGGILSTGCLEKTAIIEGCYLVRLVRRHGSLVHNDFTVSCSQEETGRDIDSEEKLPFGPVDTEFMYEVKKHCCNFSTSFGTIQFQ